MNERELLSFKEDIEQATMEVAKLRGKRELIVQQLEEKENCFTLKEAIKKADDKEKELNKLKENIIKLINDLEKKQEEIFNKTSNSEKS